MPQLSIRVPDLPVQLPPFPPPSILAWRFLLCGSNSLFSNAAIRGRISSGGERLFWVALSMHWDRWSTALIVVKTETVIGWLHVWSDN